MKFNRINGDILRFNKTFTGIVLTFLETFHPLQFPVPQLRDKMSAFEPPHVEHSVKGLSFQGFSLKGCDAMGCSEKDCSDWNHFQGNQSQTSQGYVEWNVNVEVCF